MNLTKCKRIEDSTKYCFHPNPDSKHSSILADQVWEEDDSLGGLNAKKKEIRIWKVKGTGYSGIRSQKERNRNLDSERDRVFRNSIF